MSKEMAALHLHFSRSDTMVSVPKAAIELSAIKLKDGSNASHAGLSMATGVTRHCRVTDRAADVG
ncbi:hypothetical protein [Rhizobium vallis]|uniref:hypothetical protein n=1 Tax=Rhizobium vallis TaxID=634290 RepID=UPI000F85DC28|nr:hypothetical protein [Rhizobium vallis]